MNLRNPSDRERLFDTISLMTPAASGGMVLAASLSAGPIGVAAGAVLGAVAAYSISPLHRPSPTTVHHVGHAAHRFDAHNIHVKTHTAPTNSTDTKCK